MNTFQLFNIHVTQRHRCDGQFHNSFANSSCGLKKAKIQAAVLSASGQVHDVTQHEEKKILKVI